MPPVPAPCTRRIGYRHLRPTRFRWTLECEAAVSLMQAGERVLDLDLNPLLGQDAPIRVGSAMTLGDAMEALAVADAESALVVDDGSVVGVFALRRLVDNLGRSRFPKRGDVVDEWITNAEYFRSDETLESLFNKLSRTGIVLVGDERDVKGVLTLRMLANFAHPFLLISEIERAVREAITRLLPADARGPTFTQVLGSRYAPRPAPNSIDRLTFGDYATIVSSPVTKERFREVFGASVGARLERIGEIRNGLFHFRAALSRIDLLYLEDQRRFFSGRLSRIELDALGADLGRVGEPES
jgi:CBS domain